MRLLEMLRKPAYAAIAAVSAAALAIFYIYTQVLGIVENIDIWLAIIPWHNAILFAVFAIIFGLSVAFQIYARRYKVCDISSVKRLGAGGPAAIVPFFIAQCPACASLGALFFPISVTTVLAQLSWLITLASIGLLLFLLNYLGAFRK